MLSNKECSSTVKEFGFVVERSKATVIRKINQLIKWGYLSPKEVRKNVSVRKRYLSVIEQANKKGKVIKLIQAA